MKAEDKILELLAEYLKKTDQTLERMDLAYDVLIKHSEELIELRKVSEQNQKQIEQNQKQIEQNQKQIEQNQQEIVELRKESLDLRKESIKHEIQQDVLLKEILSISRRVGNLEDNR